MSPNNQKNGPYTGQQEVTSPLSPDESQSLPLARNRDELEPGTRAGNYILEEVIGAGGGGIVYAARHRVLGRRTAVKVLRHEMASFPSMVTRFLREATAVNTIGHPNIVDIYEFGELEDGRPFYVMELLEGTDLKRLLQVRGRFSAKEALDVLTPVCLALQAAHEAGFIHRDLKAGNIAVLEAPTGRVVKLLDFGIAKLLHPESGSAGLTEPGVMLGTAHNMAPEQIRCEPLDARVDVYALGVLLYQLLTGEFPFHADQAQDIAWMHLQTPAPRASLLAPVPPAVDAVALRALEKEPARRFSTVAHFLAALREAVGEGSDTAREETGRGVGIYVEVRTDDVGDDLDDAIIEDISTILDMAEGAFGEAAYGLPLHTSSALLAAKRVGGEADDEKRAHEEATTLARALMETLSSRANADARVHVHLSIHVDGVSYRQSEGEDQIVGGQLLLVDEWPEEARLT